MRLGTGRDSRVGSSAEVPQNHERRGVRQVALIAGCERTTPAKDGALDFRGSGVHGKRGDRFIYLTWGNVGPDNTFEMFRRAKLMLDRVEPELIERATATGRLAVAVDLTDDRGSPRCSRVDPPALAWSVPEA